MKGRYQQNRPASTKAKGGNPSFFKNQEPSECVSLITGEVTTKRKFQGKDGKFYTSKNTGAHYTRTLSAQVIKKLDGDIVTAAVKLLEHGDGTTEWVGREVEDQWNRSAGHYVPVPLGSNMCVVGINGSETGAWQEVLYAETDKEADVSEGSPLNRLAGVLR